MLETKAFVRSEHQDIREDGNKTSVRNCNSYLPTRPVQLQNECNIFKHEIFEHDRLSSGD